MRVIHRNQKGFTLIELLIAIAIFGVIAGAGNAVILQLVQSSRTSAHMVAVRQVQSTAYRVNCDAMQAQIVYVPSGDGGFPFTLNWTVWDSGEAHDVTYDIVNPSDDIYELQREETITGEYGTDTITTIVGQYIYRGSDPPRPTECTWDDTEHVLTLNITTVVGLETEVRTYKIKPRPFV